MHGTSHRIDTGTEPNDDDRGADAANLIATAYSQHVP
jgi:hypothetical protein